MVISQVIENSAAEKAGLKAGDVVVSINNEKVISASGMRNIVGLLRVGDAMEINVIREGEPLKLTAVIQEADEQTVAGDRLNEKLAGATIEEAEESGKAYLVVSEVEQGSPAWDAHLRKGDIILSVNRVPVTSMAELRKVVGDNDKQILLNIQRGRTALFVLIK